jgi:6-phosphogluconolactonase/glucosamine-6-phosphate isomerase/deaminase
VSGERFRESVFKDSGELARAVAEGVAARTLLTAVKPAAVHRMVAERGDAEERERLVVMNEVPQKKTQRMTFTYPLINAADRIWVLIVGADKHPMVARCREARARGDRPAPLLGVSPAGELVWWLDEAASSGA